MWRLSFVLAFILILLAGILVYQATKQPNAYTLPEVLAAYEAGHFRVISTNSDYHILSPDKQYIAVYSDGVYRLSDGYFWENSDSTNFRFSPDGQYIAYERDGVYRLRDWQEIIPIHARAIHHSDHIFHTGEVAFSANNAYVSVTGEGVYRLSDGQKIVESTSLEVSFSPNGAYFATGIDGVYRLSDGQKLFQTYGHYPSFSPNSQYVYAWLDGLYRLRDGERLFDVGEGWIDFSPNGEYAIIRGRCCQSAGQYFPDAVYRLSDGQRLYDVAQSAEADFSPDGQYFEVDNGVYELLSGAMFFDMDTDYAFSSDSQYLAVGEDAVYRLTDMQRLFEISGRNVVFSPYGRYLAVLGDGVYDISSGSRLFLIDEGSFWVDETTRFSPDNTYLAIDRGIVYDLNTGQNILRVDTFNASFSTDGLYFHALTDDKGAIIYRLSDQYEYRGLSILDVSMGIMSLGNQILIVDESQEVLRMPFVFTKQDAYNNHLYRNPDFESEIVSYSVPTRTYLAVLAEDAGWYQVLYRGEIGWLPAENFERFDLP